MKLRLLRFIETLFSIPSAYFGDWADSIDTELHIKKQGEEFVEAEKNVTEPSCLVVKEIRFCIDIFS